MKILLYGINFAPDMTGIAKYTTEMANWLAEQGHEVRVVTAPPYYPKWEIREGYSAWGRGAEMLGKVRVYRTPIWIPASPGGLTRVLHLLSFALASVPRLFLQSFWRPDVVWVVAPAFVCAPMGLLAAKFSGARTWLHIQDFEVDAAFRLRLLSGPRIERMAKCLECAIIKRFDRVSTISARMMELLMSKGVESDRAMMFPNWVDINSISPTSTPSNYRRELGIPGDAVVAMYSGSIAGKHGLELIPEAARLLQHRHPDLYFVICGDGVMKASLEELAAGLPNVRFLPLQPLERLGELLGMADIHLLPQQGDAADLVMPSKLTGMLASGRPVIATAHEGSEIGRVVRGRGVLVPPGNLGHFVAALVDLSGDRGKRQQLGASARDYAVEHLGREQVLARFNEALLACGRSSVSIADSRFAGVNSAD